MLGSNRFVRWGTLCGVFAMVLFVVGCPGPVVTAPCETDADCDDGLFCNGAETCDVDSGDCMDGEAACAEGEMCDEDADACVDCMADEDCEEGEGCTAAGDCASVCTDDAECDDDDLCTDDSCGDDGLCVNAAADCDDDDACTDDSCDSDTGECMSADMDCDDGDPCTDDACADGACANTDVDGCCTEDADCDAGEACDMDTNQCAVPPNIGLEESNPEVDFANLEVGDEVALSAPGTALATRAGHCTCAWSVDPDTAGSFDPADACDTVYTVGAEGAYTITVEVTCDEEVTSVLQDGASTTPPEPLCEGDEECDDGEFCTGAETCVDGVCAPGMDPCGEGEFCNDDTDTCDDCVEDTDCAEGQSCVDGACADQCAAAADCADVTCSTKACDEGVCVYTDVDCDNGMFCDGVETCDAETGDCVDNDDPCDPDTETCDEDGGACDPVLPCTDDAGCDNGLFCDGAETCDLTDPENGVCADGAVPCAEDQTCNEDTDACDSAPCAMLDLTFGNDTLTGGSGDCTFDGSRDLDSGVLLTTVNNGDVLDGGLGLNTLNAEITATVTPQQLMRIQIFNIEPLAANLTFNFTNADSPTTVNANNPAGTFTAANIRTRLTDVGLTNGVNNLTVTVDDQALTEGDDACTVTLNGVTDGGVQPDITIQPDLAASSGYETVTIHSTGAIDNSIDSITDGNGNSLATVMITGERGLTVDQPFDATVTTVDGNAATGNLDLTLPNANVTVTGGNGDDTLRFAGTFDANDTVDGGADSGNTDVLESTSANLAGTTTTQTNVSNIETIQTTDNLAGDLNVTHYGASNADVAGVTGARTVTLPDGGSFSLAGNADNDVTLGLSGTATTPNVVFNAEGTAVTGNLDASAFTTMTMDSSGGANTFNGNFLLNAGAGTKITLTGGQNCTFGNTAGDQIQTFEIDANAFTGILTMTGTPQTVISVTGGTNADMLRGSASVDTLRGELGNDTITGNAGADTLSGGVGDDTFNLDDGDTDEMVADTITDFDAGTNSSTNDDIVYDLSSIIAVTGITDVVDTSATTAAATDGTFVQLASDGQTVANADIVGLIGDYTNAADAFANRTSWTIVYGATVANDDAFLVAYTSGGNVRVAVAVASGADTDSDAIDTLYDILILTGVNLSNLDSGDFTAQ